MVPVICHTHCWAIVLLVVLLCVSLEPLNQPLPLLLFPLLLSFVSCAQCGIAACLPFIVAFFISLLLSALVSNTHNAFSSHNQANEILGGTDFTNRDSCKSCDRNEGGKQYTRFDVPLMWLTIPWDSDRGYTIKNVVCVLFCLLLGSVDFLER